MRIGALRVELFISDSNCLKAKRMVIRSLKDRIRKNFNVSVAEVASHDKWQKAVLGIAAVSTEGDRLNGLLDNALDFIRQDARVQILDYEMEMI